MRDQATRTFRPFALLVGAGVLAYAWIAAGLLPFTEPENVFVVLPMIPVVILAARRNRPSVVVPPSATGVRRPRWALVWVVLAVVLGAWELLALFSSPRDDHPTMSYLADRVMSTHPGRTAMFLVWLGAGAALALRPSRPLDP